MKELKGAARRLLFELGAPVSTKGFTYAVDILCDGVVNQKPIAYKEKIYDRWAEKFGETPYNLERILRYLKDECLDQYNERFRSIFGNATSVGTYDFLEMLRFCLMDELEEM
ncbi:MAG: sporulation initiation factor Spo0A C-terminal domain-containing protein [Turicibacter sp.]